MAELALELSRHGESDVARELLKRPGVDEDGPTTAPAVSFRRESRGCSLRSTPVIDYDLILN